MMRVSRLLSAAGLVDPFWFTEASRERGRVVHTIAEAVFQEQPVSVSPAFTGYHAAIVEAVASLRFSAMCVERRLFDRDYCGRPDAIGYVTRTAGRIHAGGCIADIKSGDPHPAHGIQLAFYELLANANGFRAMLPEWFRDLPWNRVGIYVKEAGGYKIHPYIDPTDHFIAQAILDVTRWRIANGLLPVADDTAMDDDPAFPLEA